MAGHDGRRGYINHTAVLPTYRNQGIAKRIGNGFWENIGFTDREDLVYRNKNIHVLDRIDT